jgi:hypothetical protein
MLCGIKRDDTYFPVNQTNQMKTATITKISETTFSVATDLFMSNGKNWAGDMALIGDTLTRIPGVIYSYCPRIQLPNHADKLRSLPIGGEITI